MFDLRLIFLTIVGINIIGLAIFYLPSSNTQSYKLAEKTLFLDFKSDTYSFDDVEAAFAVLQQLDVPDYLYDASILENYSLHLPQMGLTNDDEYCTKHRAYFVENPQAIFQEKNFISNYNQNSLVRNIMQKVGNDIQPHLGEHMPRKFSQSRIYELSPMANGFFVLGNLHNFKEIGKHFGCLSQVYNKLVGRTFLSRKDKVALAAIDYAKSYEDRPQCFNFAKFFPQTWVLTEADQCLDFFKQFNSIEYQQLKKERTIVYIRKVGAGSHQAKGVDPVKDQEEVELRKLYANGTLCGQVRKNYVIQTYIYNPLLLNGHKFDFRVYMVVASTNPLILFYHDGFLRVSLHPYDVNSNEKSVLLTNTALSNKIFEIAEKEGHYQGLNETELRNFQMWSLEKLQRYLLDHEIINDPNWLDNYLRPEFKRAMIHLIRMVSSPFVKLSQVYELFGADFMLDSNLNLWFIECNSGPVLTGSSVEKEKFITKMLSDHFEIVYGLLKSRMKRVINYVNDVIARGEIEKLSSGQYLIQDLEKKRKEFKELIKNRFEPEFEPSATSGFSKIIDENFVGKERFSGLISDECL